MKKVLTIVFVCTLMSLTGYLLPPVSKAKTFSDENVAALNGNDVNHGIKCYNSITMQEGLFVLYCGDCQIHPGTKKFLSGTGKCFY